MFKTLKYSQMAPSLFLLAVNFLTAGFGTGEHVLKFIPLCASLASIPVFYFLSKKSLTTKHSIILANFLYAINFTMARYSAEFKQYSVDVLVFMLVLIWTSNIEINKLKPAQILKYGFLFATVFFISQPSVFVLSGFFIYHLLKNPKNHKLWLMAIPPFAAAFIYKLSLSKELVNFMHQYWKDGFITFNTISNIINENLMFFINYQQNLKFLIIFAIAGFCLFVSKNTQIHRVFAFTFLGIILAGIFQIYPILNRLILFLLPFFILFIAQCFDFKFKNKDGNLILSVFITGFSMISLALFMLGIFYKKNYDRFYNMAHTKTVSKILKENFNPKTDNLILTSTSKNIWEYYSKRLDFNIPNDNITTVNLKSSQSIKETLNTIKSGKIYWLYLPASANKKDENGLKKFLQDKKIKFYYSISFKTTLGTHHRLYKISPLQ